MKAQVASSPCEFIPDPSIAAKAQVASSPCEFTPDPSGAAKTQVASSSCGFFSDQSVAAKAQLDSSPCGFIPDASEASAAPIANKSDVAESMLTQGVDQQVPSPHALNPNATAFTQSLCKKVELNPCKNPLSSDTYSSRDESYITALLSLHGSVRDEGLASLIRSLIDSVRRVNDLRSGVDSEAIKQSILDIDSVVQKVASLREGEHMLSIFDEVSRIVMCLLGD